MFHTFPRSGSAALKYNRRVDGTVHRHSATGELLSLSLGNVEAV